MKRRGKFGRYGRKRTPAIVVRRRKMRRAFGLKK